MTEATAILRREVMCPERKGDVTDDNMIGRGTCRECGQEVGLRGFLAADDGPGQFYLRAHTRLVPASDSGSTSQGGES